MATSTEMFSAKLIVEQIPNGACLQLGIGGMPNTVGSMIAQSDLKDLGVHTEMYVDGFVDMAMAGKLTGRNKALDKGRQVYAFAAGSRDVDLTAGQAVDPGQVLVDLHDDGLGLVQHIGQVGGGQGIAEVAVAVHGGDLNHGHIHGDVFPVKPGQLRVPHGGKEAHSLADNLPVDAGAVPGVPSEMIPGVLRLGDLGHPHSDAQKKKLSRSGRPRSAPEPRKNQPKDSTEQASLMKPYYLDMGR